MDKSKSNRRPIRRRKVGTETFRRYPLEGALNPRLHIKYLQSAIGFHVNPTDFYEQKDQSRKRD